MSFQWNGDAIRRAAQEAAAEVLTKRAEQIERAMRSVRCPDHGRHPNITRVKEREGWTIKFAEPPCCAKLEEAVKRAKARELQRMG